MNLPEPRLVTIDEFFDGNNDDGSIGCNLWPHHPGTRVFHHVLGAISARTDVERVAVEITEADPGEDSWPFSDVVYVIGTIGELELQAVLSPLSPDEIAEISLGDAPAELGSFASNVFRVWWD